MKRFLLIISAILLGLALRAQSVTYTCRYWFDQNDAQAVTTAFNGNIWQAELDVGTLTEGLHTLHVQAADTSSAWCSPLSYMFLKLSPTESLLDPVDMSNLTYRFWFDQDHAHQQIGALGNGVFLIDVSELEEGLHSVNILLEGSTLTSTQSYMFVKVTQQEHLIDPIDMSHLAYHCWYDQDYENHVTDSVSNGIIQLDLDNIADGLHTVHIMLEGEALTSILSYVFVKVSQQNSLIEPIDMSNLVYHCWFDQDYENNVVAPMSNGILLLDVDNVSDGLHSVHILLEGEAMTSTLTYMFMKKPQQEDFGIAKWQYYLNGDVSQIHTTEISPVIDTLDIITLLPVETWPVRSSCFHFHPNGDEPYLNAKNEVIFRFWSNDDRVLEKSAFYIDYQVQQDIVASVFERNTTETFAAPRDNQIQWFKLDAVVGDSLSFVANKACTMQLFAPSGEEVYNASGPESVVLGGLHAWEDGTYYLAVHDVMGSGETVSVAYQYLHKYAVLTYDVHLVGNGGCSTITFQGNGFNSLLDAYLVNAQNDTIPRLDIGHESNTTTTVTFNFYQVNLGVYDAVFEFYDETIRINGALEVQEPVDIVLTSSVSYPTTFLRNTACTYTFTITNEGNMTAYAVPLYVYIATETFSGISHLEMKGIELKKLHEYISNFDDYTDQEKEALRLCSEQSGDDHYFVPYINENENGDSIAIRAGYFIVDLAPFEVKTININMISSQTIELWLSMPNEWYPISEFSNERIAYFCETQEEEIWNRMNDRSHFCCWHDGFEAGLSAISATAGGVALVALFIPDLISKGAAAVAEAISLASGAIGSISGAVASVWCQENPPQDFMDWISQNNGNWASLLGYLLNIASNMHPDVKILAKIASVGGFVLDGYGMSNSLYSRDEAHKSSRCTEDPPIGGESDPVNSLDPNDIHGYLSESGSHYMRQEIQNVQYEIEFENDTTLATAAAHTIIVRDTLDATKFDLNSLAARSVTVGDKRLELNGEQTFARTLDMRPELYVIAQINQDYDPTTGIITWTIQSLDPMTMEPTDNPYQGVLPVNYYGDGVGFIDYSINLKQAFADDTAISNRAGIIFDQEEVIMTPTWTNIVDAVKPTSHIEEVTFEDDTLNFSFISSDNRSGVWYHSLYYRNETTEQEWKVKVPKVLENYCLLHFDEYQTTEYLVMAVDSAGNVEDKEMVAEYIHYYDGPAPVTQTINLSQGWNWISTYIESSNLLEQLETNLGSNGIEIWSNSNSTEYDEEWGWFGDLDDIGMTNEEMYMVKTKTSCSMQLQGLPANPANYAITINPGWNWIGFPCNGETTLEEALSNFEAEQGDQIWSSSFSTEYDDGWGWFGDIDTLVPGEGYMYYSNSTHPKTLIFQTGSKAK